MVRLVNCTPFHAAMLVGCRTGANERINYQAKCAWRRSVIINYHGTCTTSVIRIGALQARVVGPGQRDREQVLRRMYRTTLVM
jgi:hypothetical protein